VSFASKESGLTNGNEPTNWPLQTPIGRMNEARAWSEKEVSELRAERRGEENEAELEEAADDQIAFRSRQLQFQDSSSQSSFEDFSFAKSRQPVQELALVLRPARRLFGAEQS